MTISRPGDTEIRAEDLVIGDELHLTVMGGDEYFEITKLHKEGGEVYFEASGVGLITDTISANRTVWVKKRSAEAIWGN